MHHRLDPKINGKRLNPYKKLAKAMLTPVMLESFVHLSLFSHLDFSRRERNSFPMYVLWDGIKLVGPISRLHILHHWI